MGRGDPGWGARSWSAREFDVRRCASPGRLLGLLEVARAPAAGKRVVASGTGRVSALGNLCLWRVQTPSLGTERGRPKEGRAARSQAGSTGRAGAVSASKFRHSPPATTSVSKLFQQTRALFRAPASAQRTLSEVSPAISGGSGGAWPGDNISFSPSSASQARRRPSRPPQPCSWRG